jgi:two-component system, NtrC family, nitrogen regulation sensor histidine kinase NtrY
MRLHADSRRRSIVLLTGGALLIFVLLGTLTWFNTSNVNFLNPATYEQTIALTALEVLLFLLLLLLLVLLFRTVLKVYVGQGSSGLGARLRSRMVLGAVIITFMPAALMFLFSYFLLNRSLERWFSPDASQLRDDSSRVVQELVEYVASNARSEAESAALRCKAAFCSSTAPTSSALGSICFRASRLRPNPVAPLFARPHPNPNGE